MQQYLSTSVASASRQRPARILSAEQRLMLDLRAKVEAPTNKHRIWDRGILQEARKRNQKDTDLMLAFSKNVGEDYSLDVIQRLHELLIKHGVVRPSEVMNRDSIKFACETAPALPMIGYRVSSEAELLIAFTLSAGDDWRLISEMIEERQLSTVAEIKAILSEVKMVHPSLASGAL